MVRRASGFTSERTCARSRTDGGIVGRRVIGTVRPRTTSQPGSDSRRRSTAFATALCPGASSTTMTLRFAAGAKRVCVDTERDRSKSPGNRSRAARSPASRGGEQRVHAREQLGAPVLAGGTAMRSVERNVAASVVSASSRAVERGSGGPARRRGRRRTSRARGSPRGWPARRPAARPVAPRCAHRGPDRDDLADSPRCSARRPSSRSPARVDGAMIVTAWPRRRGASAPPPDVSVDVVRTRPRERRHETDPVAHRVPSLECCTIDCWAASNGPPCELRPDAPVESRA